MRMMRYIKQWMLSKKVLFSIAICALCGSLSAQEIVTENGVAYKLYTVQKSEGLWRISHDNGITQEDLLEANPQIRETGLVEGLKIRIPMKSVDVNLQSSVLNNSTTTYVVQPGDNATQIAKRYGMKITDFYALNPECITGIAAGQTVKVPLALQTSNSYITYKVRFAETLTSIAKRFGVTTQDIVNANQVLDLHSIPAETIIRIPLSQLPAEDEYFIYHRIAPEETLYTLSQKYDILLDKIQERNPEADPRTLSLGQIIVIDKKFDKKQDIMHEVAKGEKSAWSIAKQYNIPYEELVAANPDVDLEKIKKGMILRIPQHADNYGAIPVTELYTVSTASMVDSTELYDYKRAGRPTINVALMLPFDADIEMRLMNETEQNYEKSTYTFRTRRYIEFYEGVRLALDTLAAQGVNTKLSVIDVTNRLDAQNQLQRLRVSGKTPDLIIGPAKSDEIHDVALYAREKKVPVVLPFAQSDSLLAEVPYLFQASRVDTITTPEIARNMVDYCVGKNVILLASISRKDSDIKRLHLVQDMLKAKGITPVLHTFETHEPNKFLDILSEDKSNVLLLTTTDEAKAGSILAAIANVLDQKPTANLQLVCTGEWLTYQSVEVEVYHKLNALIFSTFALDYTDLSTLRVMSNYRNRYFAEPVAFSPYFQKVSNKSGFSTYSLWGYDIASLFVGARVQFGPNFFRRINDYQVNLTQSNFRFTHVTNWGGAVNIGLRKVQFHPDGKIEVSNL